MRDTTHDPTCDARAIHERFKTVVRVVLVVGVLAAMLATPAIGESHTQVTDDCTTGEVTAADVRAAEERAAARLAELRRLGATGADVSQSVVSSVQNHLEQGQLNLDNEKYCQSSEQFETAREQARAELTRAYRDRVTSLLDRSDARIVALESAGYHTIRLHTIDEQVERQRTRLAAADSYSETRAVHERAVALHDATARLPSDLRVTLAGTFTSPVVVPIAIILTLVGAILGWKAFPYLSSPSGPGGGLEVRGQQ